MPETLRDRLAAVLGLGNDDETAYAQAHAVLDILERELIDRGSLKKSLAATQHARGLYPAYGW